LLPALFGWHNLVNAESAKSGFFLAFLVGLHVGTAAGLFLYYRRTWFQLFGGLGAQLRLARHNGVRTLVALNDEAVNAHYRLLALLAIGTIPVAIVGLLAEKALRVLFTKPLDAAIFLVVNGVILLGGELLLRTMPRHVKKRTMGTLSAHHAVVIGSSQILALLAGISRSGVTMVTGLLEGFDHENAAEFAFLLATPVIALAGLFELPVLLGPTGSAVRLQSLVGAVCAGVAAYVSVRFLAKWFATRTLWPFGVYSVLFGAVCVVRFA
jgi:undecaprenyl-diphosphatase